MVVSILRQAQQPQAQPPKYPAGETRTLSLSKRPLWEKSLWWWFRQAQPPANPRCSPSQTLNKGP